MSIYGCKISATIKIKNIFITPKQPLTPPYSQSRLSPWHPSICFVHVYVLLDEIKTYVAF